MTGGMMFKGTTGPWVAVNGGVITYSKDAWATNGVVTVAKCENEGNSRLISAAPELLSDANILIECLQEFEGRLEEGYTAREFKIQISPAIANLKNAIAKALGEQK